MRCNRFFSQTLLILLILTAFTAVLAGYESSCFSAESGHLAEGIRLYNDGRHDEALSEFRQELEIDSRCPLAYYYAAHIRIVKGQYPRARDNLSAAIRDSSGFHDAHGLLAYTLVKMGEDSLAIDSWKQFLQATGSLEGSDPNSVESITTPEKYRELLSLQTERKEQERLEAERLERERLEAERLERERLEAERIEREKREHLERELAAQKPPESDQSTQSPVEALPEPENTTMSGSEESESEPVLTITEETERTESGAEIEPPLGDLEQRIQSNIRTGLYGLLAIAFILAAGGIVVYFRIRKRRGQKEEKNFSKEVERLLDDREFEIDEEKAIREFERKKRELMEELPKTEVVPEPVIREWEPEPEPVEEASPKPPPFKYTSEKAPLTEEIKALVSRLHREGKSSAEIARTADLTKTEVDLILAVREHHIESIAQEISEESDDKLDRDQLMEAITTLLAEGASNLEIAKKLGISTSEVELAASVLEMRRSAG